MKTRLSLSTKTAVALAALVLVAALSSAAVLFFGWRTRQADRAINHEVADVVAAADLQIALLRQRIAVGAYILSGGDRKWLEEISAREDELQAGLKALARSAERPEEHALIARVADADARYDAGRARVLALFDAGQADAARELFLGEMTGLYRATVAAAEAVVELNRGDIGAALERNSREMTWLGAVTIASTAMTLLLGAGSIWLLISGIFRPLRRMTEDCRSCLGRGALAPEPDDAGHHGDLTLLGYYLRTLMSEVAQTREDLEKNQRASQQSERLAAIGNVVACVAHEIKNALTSIGGFARFIARRPDDARRVREEAQIILKVAGRLERMVRETMDYSRPVRVEPVIQSLNSLVADARVAAAAQAPEGVDLEVELDPAAPKVPFDAGYMEQVVTNLVGNAVEAVGSRGKVRVETRPRAGGVVLVVGDNGPGIPPEVQPRVFEPFFTTKKRGNGLGLAICRQIVVSHGGTIEFASSPGKGTVFTVELPAAACGCSEPCNHPAAAFYPSI